MIDQFVRLVRNYIALIDALPGLSARDFLEQCAIVLPQIYATAHELPDIELPDEGPEAENDEPASTMNRKDRIQAPMGKIAQLLGKYDLYRDVADPVFDTEAGISVLSNDLSEIYCDLKAQLIAFDKGDEQSQAEAVWEWTFGMQTHWGNHLVDALRPIHRLVHDHLSPEWRSDQRTQ